MAYKLGSYWPSHVHGLATEGHLFSYHGLYQSIYRIGSRPTHGSLESLEPYVRRKPYPPTVAEWADDSMLWYSLAAPVFGMTLVIASRRFQWIDEARAPVRRPRNCRDGATAQALIATAFGRSGAAADPAGGYIVLAMWRIFGGAVLVIAGIAAFIEAHTHRPESNYLCPEGHEPCIIGEGQRVHLHLATRGLSQTPYDLLRIGAWALVIVGALLIVVGLIGYWGAQTTRPTP